jgi:hypothetical protein
MSEASTHAAQAERLLNDPILTDAFAVVVNEAIAEWLRTPPNATEKREELYRQVVAVDRLRGRLRSIIDEGKMAERKAEAIQRSQNRP